MVMNCYEYIHWPLLDGKKQLGVIQTSLSYAEAQSLLESLPLLMIILVPIALLIAGWSGLLLTNRALRPVRQIIEKTRALNPDDLTPTFTSKWDR